MTDATDNLNRWELAPKAGIVWNLQAARGLPHKDHIEMSGQSVDFILEWEIDAQGGFRATRVVRWPMLRLLPDDTHACLQRAFSDNPEQRPLVDGKAFSIGRVRSVAIHGALTVIADHDEGVESSLTVFPCVQAPVVIDLLRLNNVGTKTLNVRVPRWHARETTDPAQGVFGQYAVEERVLGEGVFNLAPGETLEYAWTRSAGKSEDPSYYGAAAAELAARECLVGTLNARLVLETPEPVFDTLFAFSKLRAAESVFATRGGLMHGPGGYGKYLAAIWANDQAEYVSPLFPFLGNAAGNESALNCYRHFARYINPEFKPIPSSIIAEGRGFWNGAGDRGDMAMIAYGASRFALASGNPEWAEELWPLIAWCLEFCARKKLPEGIIASDTDELEGRFPAGDANLYTSCLYYDALNSTAALALALGKGRDAATRYRQEALASRRSIEKYFGADIEGFATYRYYEGNTILRSWIGIPLAMGIEDRTPGTMAALFSPRLWSSDGLLTQAGEHTVWDRATLSAFRGLLAAGRVDECLDKLKSFSSRRLLGEHVPYVVEAYPEYRQSHLAAESGLYCRIFTEGLFNIHPDGLCSFECAPRLPRGWKRMALRRICSFGLVWDMEVLEDGEKTCVRIVDAARTELYKRSLPTGQKHHVNLSERLGAR